MKKGSINSIETLGLVDGPGIRTVVFLNGCALRCKYCHNPEMWIKTKKNYTSDEIVKKIIKNKPYFKRNNGGVTFSGGEPLLQTKFLIDVIKKLKKENIHVAIDTAGYGHGNYKKLLNLVDLVIFDIKYAGKEGYKSLTGKSIHESEKFIKELNNSNKPVWIRQVIIPGITDTEEYLINLKNYIKKIKNIEKIEFLPFHHLGFDKYKKLNLENPLKNTKEMDKEECEKLYKKFQNLK